MLTSDVINCYYEITLVRWCARLQYWEIWCWKCAFSFFWVGPLLLMCLGLGGCFIFVPTSCWTISIHVVDIYEAFRTVSASLFLNIEQLEKGKSLKVLTLTMSAYLKWKSQILTLSKVFWRVGSNQYGGCEIYRTFNDYVSILTKLPKNSYDVLRFPGMIVKVSFTSHVKSKVIQTLEKVSFLQNSEGKTCEFIVFEQT